MTDVAFHFGAPDRLAYTCRLLRKATATGVRLLVRSSPAEAAALDAALWALSPTDFITHCDAAAADAVRSRSSVLLVQAGDAEEALDTRFPILVNLADDVPEDFEQFQRVIEVVSTDEQDRSLARVRWKQYTERGYTITRHDLKARGEGA
ncbi:DNA polymerase III subunit chi [Rhodoferax lacus]|uniref:DNA polymerase III subunit chi n=1 Tax=Rhodoferax lacus TaxID=2184758 RepID=A0A3E1RH72_9BURK|nr:DNA polymerase III subunit chi [Rhodoferax lacus]RFO98591.1 DNA polymerase III subunit chi [Rhodoferax lacus]